MPVDGVHTVNRNHSNAPPYFGQQRMLGSHGGQRGYMRHRYRKAPHADGWQVRVRVYGCIKGLLTTPLPLPVCFVVCQRTTNNSLFPSELGFTRTTPCCGISPTTC
jgi:hypothetical protein